MGYTNSRGQDPCQSYNTSTINVNRKTAKLVSDVIQRLFPVNEIIHTGIECYLYYGKSPWGFRFRIREKGVHQLIKQYPWGLWIILLTVIKQLGFQNCPRLRRTNSSCREDKQQLSSHSYWMPIFRSPAIPIEYPSSETPKTGSSGVSSTKDLKCSCPGHTCHLQQVPRPGTPFH